MTMSMKHTPGPWRFHAQGEANEYCILGDNSKWIAGFRQNGEMHTKEQHANARLIAAAPELLEALKEIVSLEHSPMNFGVARTIARSAIAKARGEA